MRDGQAVSMLIELYIAALLAGEYLADQVREMWNAGAITDDLAAWTWWHGAAMNDRFEFDTDH